MPPALPSKLEKKFEEFRQKMVTPGVAISISDNFAPYAHMSFGALTYDDIDQVSRDTVYDVASLTKPVVTCALAILLSGKGRLDIDSPAASYLPELGFPPQVTIAHLLGHGSGYPAHVHFYERLKGARLENRLELYKLAAAEPLVYSTGSKSLYSDLGYMLTGAIIERVAGENLAVLFQEMIALPLQMTMSKFPSVFPYPKTVKIAPTENYEDRGLAVGSVHDENCFAVGGVAGHAGLFSTANDLDVFARAFLDAVSGNPSIFDTDTVREYISRSAAPKTTWRMGWDTPSQEPGVSHAGDAWPRDGIGHLGFTGTSLWLDPPKGRAVTILTNRVHPTRENQGIKELRRTIMDTVFAMLPA